MTWYASTAYSEPPSQVLYTEDLNHARNQLSLVELAYKQLMSDIASGYVDVDYSAVEYPDYHHIEKISISALEINLLAWYQFYDEIICGEVSKDVG